MKVKASAARMKLSAALCDEEGVEGEPEEGSGEGGAVVALCMCVCEAFSGGSPLLPVMLSRH